MLYHILKLRKQVALAILVSLLSEILSPLAAYALTSGPAQPEFSSFEPVATTGMVNEFSGAFTYNLPVLEIPGANGGGYALSLSYHGGTTADEDASWVGYGWTLNPGAINRAKRGFPDDYYNEDVTYYNKTPKNETYAIGYNLGIQGFSSEIKGIGMNSMIRYNNYTGFSVVQGFSASVAGLANLGYSVEDGYGKFSLSINPAKLLEGAVDEEKIAEEVENEGLSSEAEKAARFNQKLYQAKCVNSSVGMQNAGLQAVQQSISNYGMHILSAPPRPTNTLRYKGESYTIRFGLTVSPAPGVPGELGFNGGITGSYSYQEGYGVEPLKAYGFMYSAEGASSGAVMDYFSEKEGSYTKKDRYLGIPYSNADQFALTGEGLGGGFRLHNRRVGVFRSNAKQSKVNIYNVGAELGVGTAWGFGADISGGQQEMKVGRWNSSIDSKYRFASQADSLETWYDGEPYFFRFTNDLGGSVQYASGDDAYKPGLNIRRAQPSLSAIDTMMNTGKRSGRSSYVGYHTNEEMMRRHNHQSYGSYFSSYTRDARTRAFVDRTDAGLSKGVGELSVVNANGMRYVYGLPVYSRNERNLQFGFDDPNVWKDGNKVAFVSQYESKAKVVSGEVRRKPYASTFLLTEITSQDYIDRTLDGPTDDDFGGYTKFNYRRAAGTSKKTANNSDEWYKWRTPYVGLNYNAGKLAEGRDDAGSVASGEKEIYYLESIETKTHIAYFVTNKTDTVIDIGNGQTLHVKGSGQERLDAYEARMNKYSGEEQAELQSSGQPWLLFTGYDGKWSNEFAGKSFNNTKLDSNAIKTVKPNKVQYLERIELYAKNPSGKAGQIVKKTHLEYDYSIMASGNYNYYFDTTYKNNQISRIDTIYYYPSNLNSAIGFSTQGVLSAHQSTKLSAFRYGKLTLKKIWFEYEGTVNAKISPYEFSYEYKKPADYAPEITSRYSTITDYKNSFGNRSLNHLGYAVGDENPSYSETRIDRWGNYARDGWERSVLHRPYVNQRNQGGFDPAAWQLKVIKLPSGGEIQVQYEQHDYAYVQDRKAMVMVRLSDQIHYMSGLKSKYKFILNVDADLDGVSKTDLIALLKEQFINRGEKIYFKFLYSFQPCPQPSWGFPTGVNEYITGYADVENIGLHNGQIYVELKGDYTPVELAREYAKANKTGKLDCNSPNVAMGMGANHDSQAFWSAMLDMMPGVPVLKQGIDAFFGPTVKPYPEYSYFRLPVLQAKKGGGVRVKRILMYDKGLETGDAVLYGSEYIYKARDEKGNEISSGVATNEPAEGREENALVTALMKRDEQAWAERVVAGKDLEQFEGPLGESLLPSPSVGYSKVTVRNIHSGKTAPGFTISEFYTAKDFPLKMSNTDINTDSQTPNPVIELMSSITTSNYWLTQGYSFILNSMHGQAKKIAKYGGEYANPSTWYVVESQETEYFKPGETIPVMKGINQPFVYEQPGKEMEVVMESHEISDITDDYALTFDAGITLPSAFLLPLPFGTLSFRYTHSESELRTYVVNKVIQYPAIQKSVRSYKDGIYHLDQNIAFNSETGKPVLTASSDGFDKLSPQLSPNHSGVYLTHSFPASMQYSAMGQKAVNERAYAKATMSGTTLTLSTNASLIQAGDMVMVRSASMPVPRVYYILGGSNLTRTLVPLSYSAPVHPSGSVTVEVAFSGRTNQLEASIGSLTTYGRSISTALSNNNLATLTSNVVAAEAQTFEHNWNYDESVFGKVGTTGDNFTPHAYQKGSFGRWRPKQTFVYKQTVQNGGRNYNTGTLAGFQFFNYVKPIANPGWLALNTTTKYSPHGEAIEETDILNIPSGVRFSHKNTVPSILAKNSEFEALYFESFEDGAKHTGANPGHTGRYSFALPQSWKILDSITGSSRLNSSGGLLKFWAKGGGPNPCNVMLGSTGYTPLKVAQSGDWSLFSVRVNVPASGRQGIAFQALTSDVYIDDIRFQPADAQGTCYAYDFTNLKLVAQFDDQHFALLYQYNGEGKLVRKLKETQRGIKTVEETQYHTPLLARNGDAEEEENGGSGQHSIRRNLKQGPASLKSGNDTAPIKAGGKFEMLDIKLSPGQKSIKIFGMDTVPQLSSPKLPEMEKLKFLDGSMNIDAASPDSLAKDLKKEKIQEEAKAGMKKAMKEKAPKTLDIKAK